MKKLLLLSLLFNFSCDTVTEKDLYTRFDAEWLQAAALQARECINDSVFLNRAESYTEFDNAPFEVGYTYLIEQDLQVERRIFAQFMTINPTDMVIRFNSSDDTLDKEVTFTELEARELVLSVFNPVLCSAPAMLENFTSSGVNSETLASFVWDKNRTITPDDDDSDTDP